MLNILKKILPTLTYSNNEMISQEISRNLYDSLKDVHNKNVKEFVENPILTKEDIPVSKIIGIMLNQNVHEVFMQLPGKSISCINIRDILSSTHIETLNLQLSESQFPL